MASFIFRRQLQVNERDVRLDLAKRLDRFQPVADRSNDLEVVHRRKQCNQALSNHLVIFYEHDANFFCHLYLTLCAIGTRSVTLVPRPGSLVTSSEPSIVAARSFMPSNP